MIQAFSVLFACQLLGEGMVHVSGAPVPGPVVGLVLLAIGLAWWERRRPAHPAVSAAGPLAAAADGLLGHLSLLFVPAAVGVVQQGAVLAANGVVLAVALVVSTILTLVVTAWVFVWATRFAAPDVRATS